MAITESSLLEELGAMLHHNTGAEPGSLSRDTDLRLDLGIDSLSLVELLLAVEARYGVTVPDEMAQVRTVGEAVDFMTRLLEPAQ